MKKAKMIIIDDDLINQQEEKEKLTKEAFDECSVKMKTRFNSDNAIALLVTTSELNSFLDEEREKFIDTVSEEFEIPKEFLK